MMLTTSKVQCQSISTLQVSWKICSLCLNLCLLLCLLFYIVFDFDFFFKLPKVYLRPVKQWFAVELQKIKSYFVFSYFVISEEEKQIPANVAPQWNPKYGPKRNLKYVHVVRKQSCMKYLSTDSNPCLFKEHNVFLGPVACRMMVMMVGYQSVCMCGPVVSCRVTVEQEVNLQWPDCSEHKQDRTSCLKTRCLLKLSFLFLLSSSSFQSNTVLHLDFVTGAVRRLLLSPDSDQTSSKASNWWSSKEKQVRGFSRLVTEKCSGIISCFTFNTFFYSHILTCQWNQLRIPSF